MFGKHWTAAQGHVVDKRTVRTTGDGLVSLYEFVVDVTTGSGEVFRAKVGEPRIATNFIDPSVGMTVRVEYDEKSRDVRFDKDDPQLSRKALKQNRNSGFDDVLHQPAGTPAGGVVGGAGSMSSELEQVQALLAARDLTSGAGQVIQPQVIQMEPGSPEAAALRAALLQAMGGLPATAPDTDPGAPPA